MNINSSSGEDIQKVRLSGSVFVDGTKQEYTASIKREDGIDEWVTQEKFYDVKSPSEVIAYLHTDDVPATLVSAGDVDLNGATKFTFYDLTTGTPVTTPFITIDPVSFVDIPFHSYVVPVVIKSNVIWKAETEGEGFSVDMTSGESNQTINLYVDENTSSSKRTGKLIITAISGSPVVSATGNYRQDECPDLKVVPASLDVPYTASTQTLTLTSPLAWTATAPSWVTLSATSGPGEETPQGVDVTFPQNDTDTRTGDIVFTPASGDPTTVSIRQAIGRHTINAVSLQPQYGVCTGTGLYMWNSQVRLVARPISTAHLVQWEDGVTTNERYVTVGSSDATYNAIFAINSFKLSVSTDIASTSPKDPAVMVYIDSDPTQTEISSVAYGEAHTLHAVSGASHTFNHWELDGVTVSTDADYSITMPNSSASYVAVYDEVVFTVTLHHDTPATRGTLYINGEETLTAEIAWGNTAILYAYPASGFHFTQWSDGDTSDTKTITVTSDVSFGATFDPDVYIDITPSDKIEFNADGTKVSVDKFTIDSNVNWDVTTPSDWPTGWSVSPTSGTGAGTVTVTVNKNDEYAVKEPVLTFVPDETSLTSKTRTVSQKANALTNVVVNNLSYPETVYGGATASPTMDYTITWLNGDTATTGAAVTYELESGSWSGASIDASTGVITWTENLMPVVRTAHVKVTATLTDHSVTKTATKTYDAIQQVAPNRFTLSETSWSAGDSPETKTVTVTGNIPWTAASDSEWITPIDPSGSAASITEPYTTSVNVSVLDNDTSTVRSGNVTFTPSDTTLVKTLAVEQAVKEHTITVTRSSVVTEDGGPDATLYIDTYAESTQTTLSKTVVHRTDHSIIAVETPSTSWTFDGWYDGTTLKSSSATTALNDITADVSLTAKFQYIPTWEITSLTSIDVNANGTAVTTGSQNVSLNSNLSWEITSSSIPSWIHPSVTSGTGSATVILTFDANSDTASPADRTATLIFHSTDSRPRATQSDLTVSITQYANQPTEIKDVTFEYPDASKTGGTVNPTLSYTVVWKVGTTSTATQTFSKTSGDATLDTATGALTWTAYAETSPRDTEIHLVLTVDSSPRGTITKSYDATATQYGRELFLITTTSNDTSMGTTTVGENTTGTTATKSITEGETAVILASPASHYHFVKWEEGTTVLTTTDAQYSIPNILAEHTYTATFAIDTFTITLVLDAPTACTAIVTGDGTYDYGTTKSITCTIITAHYHLVNWTDADGNVVSTTSNWTTSALSKNETYTAHIAIDQHTLTVNGGAIDSTTGPSTGSYDWNSTHTLYPTPAEHYHFVKWSDDVTTNPRTVTINSSSNVYTTVTEIDQHTLTLLTTPDSSTRGMGTVTGAGTYNWNQDVTVEASDGTDYTFTSWSDGGDATHTVNIDGDKTLTAVFTLTETWSLTSASSIEIDADSTFVVGTNEVQFNSNLEWTATSSQTWLHLSAASGAGSGSETITVTCDNNSDTTSPADRTATITIHCTDSRPSTAPSDLVVSVTQYANAPVSITIDKFEYPDATKAASTISPLFDYTITWKVGTTSSGATKTFSKTSGDFTLESTITGDISWTAYTETSPRSGEVHLVLDASSSRGSATVSADATATQYGRDTFTITTSANDSTMGSTTVEVGGVIGGSSAQVPDGDPCTLHATPKTHYHFVEWTEGGVQVSTSADYTIASVTAARTFIAVFAIDTHTITLATNPVSSTTGMGSVTIVGGSTSGTYDYGTVITINATDGEGYTFSLWDDTGVREHTVTVSEDKTITATFAINTYYITVNTTTGGTAASSGWVNYNTSKTITATADEGYSFAGWIKDTGTTYVSTDATYTINNVKDDATYTAYFTINKYNITVTSSPASSTRGMGSVSGTGSYDYGTSVTISAADGTDYTFTKWNDDVTTASRTITVPAEDKTYTATFTLNETWSLTSASSLEVDADNTFIVGTNTIAFSSNLEWSLTASETWLHASKSSGTGSGSETVTISCDDNSDTASPANRTATITIHCTDTRPSTTPSDLVVTVLQYANSPQSFSSVTFGYDDATKTGGTFNPTLSYTVNWKVGNTTTGASKTFSKTSGEATLDTTTGALTWAAYTGTTVRTTVVGLVLAISSSRGSISDTYSATAKQQGRDTYAVTTSADDPTMGATTVEVGGTVGGATAQVPDGDSCILHATANPHYHFVKWMEGSTEVSTSADYTITSVTAARTFVAYFAIDTHTITVTTSPASTTTGMGSVNVDGSASKTVNYGSSVTIAAVNGDGYTFSEWDDLGNQSHSVTVTADRTYTATFTINTYTITAVTTTGGTVSGGGSVNYGNGTTITATADAGYTFAGWKKDSETSYISTSASYSISGVTANATYTAYFTINQYTLTLASDPAQGTTGIGTLEGAGTYNYNSSVTIKANDGTGYTFSKWNDNVTTAERTITMPASNVTYTATYTINQYTITVNTTTGGTAGTTTVVDYGGYVDIEAAANTGYTFAGWKKNSESSYISGAGASYRVSGVTADATYTAYFTINKYTLTLASDPAQGTSGIGTLVGAGTYDYNSSVTIKANDGAGYTFTKWNDDVTTAERTITMPASNVTYTATYTILQFSVTVNTTTGGTVSGGGDVDYGGYKDITATPASGYSFLGWKKDSESTYASTDASYRVTNVTTDVIYTAYFGKNTYTVTLSTTPSTSTEGMGSVSGAGSYEYEESVTITATNGAGYTFTKWNDNVTDNPRTFTMPASNVTYTATFTINSYTITTATTTGGTVSAGGSVNYGGSITITATASTGYSFAGWKKDSESSYISGAGASYKIEDVKAAATYTAYFTKNSYVLTLATDPVSSTTGMGTVSGAGTYEYGQEVTISATDGAGYTFSSWDDAGTRSHTITMPAANTTITATFTINAYTITTATTTGGTVSAGGSVNYGGSITIEATPDSGYSFLGWKKDSGTAYVSSDASFTVTNVTANATYTAYFGTNAYTLTITTDPVSTTTGMGSVTGGGSYEYGASVTMTASNGAGYTFSKWNDDVTTNPRTITMPANNVTYTATFTINSYTITVNTTTGGTVTGGGSVNYLGSTTIKATPATGYSFAGWKKDSETSYESTTASYTVSSVTANAEYTAYFTQNTYTLTLATTPAASTAGMGSVTGGGTYVYGQEVTISATDGDGYTFSSWDDAGAKSHKITMPASDTTITATFTINAYTITVNTTTGGTVSAGGSVNYGGYIDITATPDSGYAFLGWKKDSESTYASTDASYRVTNVTAAATYTAYFSANAYTLTLATNPVSSTTGMGSVTGAGSYNYGTSVTFSASNGAGYTFTKWNDDVTTASRTITMPASNVTYTATFTINTYTITATAGTGGTVTGGGSVNYLGSTTLEATPNTGYTFTGWTKDGGSTYVSTSASYTVSNVTADAEYTAVFTINTYTITIAKVGNGTVTPAVGAHTYDYGTVVTLKAEAGTGYSFTSWTDGGTAEHTITVTEDKTYTATFTINTYTITIATAGDGTGTVTPTVGAHTYDYGTAVTLNAIPDTGVDFTSWSDGGTQSHTITVTEDKTYTATFSLHYYTITMAASPTEGGTAETEGGETEAAYGDPFWILGTANTGYSFAGWKQDSESGYFSTDYEEYVTMPASNVLYTAYFTLNSYYVMVTAGAGGTVTGGGTYSYGDSITIKATASTHYTFSRWTKNGVEITGAAAEYTTTVTGADVYNAEFTEDEKATITVSVNDSTMGSATVGATSSATTTTYTGYVGAYCIAQATANSGYKFKNWSDGSTTTTDPQKLIQIPSGGLSLLATFVADTATITLTVSTPAGGIGGTVTGAGTYTVGTTQSISATASSGYVFKGWYKDGGSSYASTDNPYSITVEAGGTTYTAEFYKTPLLTISSITVD